MNHYDKEELELYRNGEMSLLGRIVCAAHLGKCAECAKKLHDLDDDDDFIVQLRNSVKSCGTIRSGKSSDSTR
ncbi:MAG: hypothetical protein MJ016_00460 [Victivallaceae bacterium]|nr:hypothetical protein [Victivallaceae bacterium]